MKQRGLDYAMLSEVGITSILPIASEGLSNTPFYQWQELKDDFPGLAIVKRLCFTGPFYEGHSHHDKSWPVGLRHQGPPRIMEYGIGRKYVARPHTLNFQGKNWDGLLQGCIPINQVLDFQSGEDLIRNIYMGQVWLVRNDGSAYALNVKTGFQKKLHDGRVNTLEGGAIRDALAREIPRLPYAVKVSNIFVAEFWLQYEPHRNPSNETHALRITAFRPPKNEDWINPSLDQDAPGAC